MAILLTNNTYYIALNKHNGVFKVIDINKAKDFKSVEKAMEQKNKAPSKCAGYYIINTDIQTDIVPVIKKSTTSKRKSLSASDRLDVYRKTEGHCYLCGDFVDFDLFEIEHKIPISKGGTNDLSNLFCSCHICNLIKHDISSEDFMKRILKIFMYQIKIKNKKSLKWKVLRKELQKIHL